MSRRMALLTALLAVLAAAVGISLFDHGEAQAARISDIRKTRHNLAATSTNTVKAQSETEVCVFCHTPHAASQGMRPLWNKTPAGGGSQAVYTLYNSNSLDAAANGVASLDEPDGSSKLCLSCHDGTVAIGNVNVLRGKTSQSITMSGGVTTMGTSTSATGLGVDTGYTRVIGTDLSNDHPISFTYDPTRASNDGELFPPTLPNEVATRTTTKRGATVSIIGNRGPGAENKPVFPLEDGKMQCATCHDPHIRDDTADLTTGWSPTEGPIKFLRESRLQQRVPAQGQYSSGQDILCLGCHNKGGWAQSAHALALNTYQGAATSTGTPTNIRQFPTSTTVQSAACLNCHDTHTVKGAKRLLRDGTDGTVSGQTYKSGGNQATEETCYACHSANGGGTVGTSGGIYPPDVQIDFIKTYSMPIKGGGATESHDVGTTDGNLTGSYLATPLSKNTDHLGANGIEGRTQLGSRHVECTDCHNPHRTLKNERFDNGGGVTTGHHKHEETSTTLVHTNIASGALRGAFGVEPDYGTEASVAWGTGPTKYKPKFGDPGAATDTTVGASYVTREYQICLKCHSSYAYGTTPPTTGPSVDARMNGLTQYTDQAMEFASPTNDQGESGFANNNHRSWHPVRRETNRGTAARAMGTTTNNWLKPWRNGVGTQTMYCTDCHGGNTPTGTSMPTAPAAWGPHGSTNPFLLKGAWGNVRVGMTKGGATVDGICFRCHERAAYAANSESGAGYRSGFCCGAAKLGNKTINLHLYHASKIAGGGQGRWQCTFCHVAVPHGWKNKALLVNLNADEGAEISNGALPYTKSPYFFEAVLKIKTFARSGQWEVQNCGDKASGTDESKSKSWMTNTCRTLP